MNEQEIFVAAIQMTDAEQREAWVDQVCADDAEMRARIASLMRAHERASEFLESPPPGLDATENKPLAEGIGTMIGSYKLLQQLGEGGMGIVYLAERQHPVKQRVALKIIKHGMDTKQFVARFEAERQALALVDHPNIAKILDAGCTGTGRPYFVMELVKEVAISTFCDENRLTTRERLELFVQVCQAV